MPYIQQHRRDDLSLQTPPMPSDPGELNYCITMLLVNYLLVHKISYQHINDCLGALEGAKLEFYARVARPYEGAKVVTNGDVYPDWSSGRAQPPRSPYGGHNFKEE